LGCLLPLSGTYAAYGQRALQGVEMALIHFSQIIPDFKPKLIVKDTKSDPEQANKALTEMAKEGVAAIIGPMITAEQVAMTADALGVPILTLTQKDYITDSGPYVFRNFITPQMQVKALVNYAAESLGAKRFAILYPQENYGVTFMDIFWDEIAVHNGTIAGVESYHTSQTDFADAIKKLVGLYYPMSRNEREQALAHAEMLRNPEEALQFLEFGGNLFFPKNNPDNEIESEPDADEDDTKDPEELESIVDFNAVFIPDSPKKVGLIVPQLAYYDIRDVYLLGTNIWHSDSLIRMSRKYLSDAVVVDGFFVESEDPNIRKFVSNFKNIYSEDPEIISATAYDSALIILDLLKDPTIELRSQVKDRLLSMKPYNGLTGKTTFRPNGDVSKNLFILGIRSGRFIELGRINPYPANIQLSTTTKDFSDENKLNDNPEMIGE
jgi:ABC-type branched-subunit amino acid transport system substrate-binding protein